MKFSDTEIFKTYADMKEYVVSEDSAASLMVALELTRSRKAMESLALSCEKLVAGLVAIQENKDVKKAVNKVESFS